MLNVGPAELLVVLVVALLVLGPNKLPDAARQVGRAIGEMRKLSSGFQAEMRDAMKEPVEGKPRSSPTAASGTASTGGSLASPRPPAGDAPEASSPVSAVPDAGPEGSLAAAPAAPPDGGATRSTNGTVDSNARSSGEKLDTPPDAGTDGATAT